MFCCFSGDGVSLGLHGQGWIIGGVVTFLNCFSSLGAVCYVVHSIEVILAVLGFLCLGKVCCIVIQCWK